jgi:hypothetical protein
VLVAIASQLQGLSDGIRLMHARGL